MDGPTPRDLIRRYERTQRDWITTFADYGRLVANQRRFERARDALVRALLATNEPVEYDGRLYAIDVDGELTESIVGLHEEHAHR